MTPPPTNFPFFGEIIEHDPGHRLVMRRRLDPREDLYAEDHTVGGRDISKVDPNQHGLPVMPMTFDLEIMAEAALKLVPNKVVLGMKNVQLLRWLAFEREDPTTIEVTARVLAETSEEGDPTVTGKVRVEIQELHDTAPESNAARRSTVEGVVLLGQEYPEPPPVKVLSMADARQCSISRETLYKNLFHGQVFQGVISIGQYGEQGIEAQVQTLPRDGIFRSIPDPRFVTDPVLIDVAMHPLAGWHLEQQDQSGRILLPYEMETIRFYGPCPEVGTTFGSRGRVEYTSARKFIHAVEAIAPDGRLWCRLRVKYWRFYLPFCEYNFHGPKDAYYFSQNWLEVLPDSDAAAEGDESSREVRVPDHPASWCVRLEPLRDMQQSAMQLAGAKVSMSPLEFKWFCAWGKPDEERAELLFGRIAAKDAIRRLWANRYGQRLFLADVEIETDRRGRLVARPRDPDEMRSFPNVSISHTTGLVAAIASFHPQVGIDLEQIEPRKESFERRAFDDVERRLLDSFGTRRDEGITRLWCAKEAIGKALGRELVEGPHSVAVRAVDPESGEVRVELGSALAEEFPELAGAALRVRTVRENDWIVATTLCEKAS